MKVLQPTPWSYNCLPSVKLHIFSTLTITFHNSCYTYLLQVSALCPSFCPCLESLIGSLDSTACFRLVRSALMSSFYPCDEAMSLSVVSARIFCQVNTQLPSVCPILLPDCPVLQSFLVILNFQFLPSLCRLLPLNFCSWTQLPCYRSIAAPSVLPSSLFRHPCLCSYCFLSQIMRI